MIKSDNDWLRSSGMCTRKHYILMYIPVPTTYMYRCYCLNAHWHIYWMITKADIITICVNFLRHIFHTNIYEDKWMLVDTIYDLIMSIYSIYTIQVMLIYL